jgi:hypothetical protein
MSKVEIIRFNVGGTPYEVALATLMKSPETMLAKLASQRWREKSGNKVEKSIFIDRDGEIFKYILAWYRNNVIIIPRTIPVDAVENEVKYFSLPVTVVVEQEKSPITESFKEVTGFKRDRQEDFSREFLERQTDLFATWAVQNAIQEERLTTKPTYSTQTEYFRIRPLMDMKTAGLMAKNKIKELGLASICTVEIGREPDQFIEKNMKLVAPKDLKFTFKQN